MKLNRMEVITVAIVLVATGIMAAGIVVAIQKHRRWHAWADVHCKIIGEVSDTVVPTVTVGADGKLSTSTSFEPGKTGYQCDDGKTYWR